MRAVNLVPAEDRSGGLSGGRSGGMVYAVLAALFVLVIAAGAYALVGKSQKQTEQQLAGLQQSAAAYSTAAAQYASFETAAKTASDRIAAVDGLAKVRFDWAGSMRDLARIIPKTSQVTAMTASVSSGITAPGGASSTLRDAIATPAFVLNGCSSNQDAVANLVTNLQAMRRVTQVTLESSEGAKGGGGGPSESCSLGTNSVNFVIDVFFTPGDSAPSGAVDQGSTTPVAATTPATTPSK
jgi:Tfp pilus assembly protein PilN